MKDYISSSVFEKHLYTCSLILQGTHEAILDKQNTFDALAERAQTLLQSTTDNRVTSQLTQLSARYTTLMSASKVSITVYSVPTSEQLFVLIILLFGFWILCF